jgi:multidrug efflux pump subunit AcrB
MVLSMGCGLVFATPLTLLLVPCLFMIGQDINKIFRRKKK